MQIEVSLTNSKIDLSLAKILVVDDQAINIQTINNLLSDSYTILAATSGEDAISICNNELPDLILMDVIMPEMDGLTTCQKLKQQDLTNRIPIIFFTAESKHENDCWLSGGVDFIGKPVNPVTLRNRVKAHLTLKFQSDILARLAYIDGLTSSYNRRYFDDHIERLINVNRRNGQDSGLLLLDIDFFKQYNDQYGHLEGDDVLKTVASVIREELHRPKDFLARYGGEEFAVVLPDTNLLGAVHIAEIIKDKIFNLNIEHKKSPLNKLTISIGVTTINTSLTHQLSLIKHADVLLYQAKSTGRNKVVSQ